MYCKHCQQPIEHVLGNLWNGFEGRVLRQYCFVDPVHGSRLHEPDYEREQRKTQEPPEKQPGDCLREELDGIEIAIPPNLEELIHTANETGYFESGISVDDVIRSVKVTLLAQSYGSRKIDHLKM